MVTVRRLSLRTGIGVEMLEAGAAGSPPLLLVHGFVGAKEDFADHMEALASIGHHVVAPDLRGHGGSDRPASLDDYSLAVLAADVVALADELGWGRFTLLGHSMGGMVAQLVAVDHGDRLRGLVLMDTGHGPVGGLDPGAVALGRIVVEQGGMELLAEVSRDRGGALDTAAHQRLLATRPGYREFCDAKSVACSPSMWRGMVDELVTTQSDRLDALARAVRVPTLVVVGEQDQPFLEPSRRMAAAIPGAQLEVIPDAGHSPQFENGEAWLRTVRGFLSERLRAASDT